MCAWFILTIPILRFSLSTASSALPLSLSLSACFSPRTTTANDQSLRGNHWICNLRKSSDIALYYKRAGPRLPPSTKLPSRRRGDFACEYFQIREYAKSRGTRDPPVIFVGSKCLQLYSRILLSRLKINWISPDACEITDSRDMYRHLSEISSDRISHIRSVYIIHALHFASIN